MKHVSTPPTFRVGLSSVDEVPSLVAHHDTPNPLHCPVQCISTPPKTFVTSSIMNTVVNVLEHHPNQFNICLVIKFNKLNTGNQKTNPPTLVNANFSKMFLEIVCQIFGLPLAHGKFC